MKPEHTIDEKQTVTIPRFPTFNAAKDPIALITQMRNTVCGREAHMKDAWSLCKLIKFVLGEWQKESETKEEWME